MPIALCYWGVNCNLISRVIVNFIGSMNTNVKEVCDLQPISYKPEVVNGENTWSWTFEYKNTQNQVGLQITQKVTLHAKNGNESQY